jgi:transcriptional regulator with XRE-family HTH domain
MITAAQCRAGRALIEWSREQLAEAAGVSLRTIVDFERAARSPREVTLLALERALSDAGVQFLDHGEKAGGGPGVRVRSR